LFIIASSFYQYRETETVEANELKEAIMEILGQGDISQTHANAPIANVLALVYLGDAVRELTAHLDSNPNKEEGDEHA
jgi:hypothetical protein